MFTIYGLANKNKEIWYIGQSANIKERLYCYRQVKDGKKTKREMNENKVAKLQHDWEYVVLLKEIWNKNDLDWWERYFYNKHKINLVNICVPVTNFFTKKDTKLSPPANSEEPPLRWYDIKFNRIKELDSTAPPKKPNKKWAPTPF